MPRCDHQRYLPPTAAKTTDGSTIATHLDEIHGMGPKSWAKQEAADKAGLSESDASYQQYRDFYEANKERLDRMIADQVLAAAALGIPPVLLKGERPGYAAAPGLYDRIVAAREKIRVADRKERELLAEIRKANPFMDTAP